jgi:hypothetical protein
MGLGSQGWVSALWDGSRLSGMGLGSIDWASNKNKNKRQHVELLLFTLVIFMPLFSLVLA